VSDKPLRKDRPWKGLKRQETMRSGMESDSDWKERVGGHSMCEGRKMPYIKQKGK